MQSKDFCLEIDGGEIIEIGDLRPEDASGVARLFQEIYGEKYPMKIYYDPEGLIAENRARKIISTVARTKDGRIVGHMGLFLSSATFAKAYESGVGLVLPDYRKSGISTALLRYSYDTVAYRYGIAEVYGEAVCNHTIMQRTIEPMRFTPRALEVDLMPGEAYRKEGTTAGRVATLLAFRSYIDRPQTVYIPAAYAEALDFLYLGIKERSFQPSRPETPLEDVTEGSSRTFDFAGVTRITAARPGADLRQFLQNACEDGSSKGAIVFQLYLPLSSAAISAAVGIARSMGFFLGGVLPRWFDADGLLMQKMAHRPHWEDIQLHQDRSRQIMEIVKSDWEQSLTAA
jgi:GNAT superfamily N-acetyltransferase